MFWGSDTFMANRQAHLNNSTPVGLTPAGVLHCFCIERGHNTGQECQQRTGSMKQNGSDSKRTQTKAGAAAQPMRGGVDASR